mmetsp:Transcript_26216/g.46828  ORF Transcript_26216/g.46828 Transcript_26216/m.46828 type:complete len:94 (-) Transcript_26216:1600-1881(-)
MNDRHSTEVRQYLSLIQQRKQEVEEEQMRQQMPSVPEIEPSVLISEAEFSQALNAEIHRLKLTSNSNTEVLIQQGNFPDQSRTRQAVQATEVR